MWLPEVERHNIVWVLFRSPQFLSSELHLIEPLWIGATVIARTVGKDVEAQHLGHFANVPARIAGQAGVAFWMLIDGFNLLADLKCGRAFFRPVSGTSQ